MHTAHFSGGVRVDLHFPGEVATNSLLSYFVFAIISHSLITRPLPSPCRRVRTWVEVSPNTEGLIANTYSLSSA